MFNTVTHNGVQIVSAPTGSFDYEFTNPTDADIMFMTSCGSIFNNSATVVGISAIYFRKIGSISQTWYEMPLALASFPLYTTDLEKNYTTFDFSGGFEYKVTIEEEGEGIGYDLELETYRIGDFR
ncbi:MAG: hypothetical protein QM489_01040 [Candidatus Izemoplasma sp.]